MLTANSKNRHISGRISLLLGLVILPIFFSNCIDKNAMKEINRLGEITVLTRNNAHCYYIYQNQEMGFEYDLAKAFANYLGVALKIRVTEWENLIEDVSEGAGDLIAANMTVTPSRRNLVDFSSPYLTVQQMVIIHKGNNQIKEMKDLKGKTIHIRKGASYKERLNELNEEGFGIDIKEHHDLTTEELIRQVAEKEIEITIADSNIALLNRRYYPKIIIAFPIKQPRPLAWAVKKGEKDLLRKINSFFETIQSDGTFAKIYEQYYAGVEVFDYLDLRKFHKRIKTMLPAYEDIIKESAEKNGFDWRLIAAMIYQESHFEEDAVSHTGVGGIMQLTQATANDMSVADRMDPAESIRAGVKYLKKLYNKYERAEGRDRILITLASYNVGHGHITDAQKLAMEMGLDPHKWSSLEKTLPLLRCQRYYQKSKNGYCRGAEPVRYVKRILIYYDILKRKAIES